MTSAAVAGHVLVTGAAGAIGGAVARELRARRPTVRLTLLDRDAGALAASASALGGDVAAVGCDLRDVDGLGKRLAAIERERGAVDGLVSSAGLMEVRRFEALDWARANDVLTVDLVAPLRLMQACVAGMLARGGGGFVVNVTSMAGRVPLKGCAFYGAAKAGLSMASEIAHAELGPRGIHVLTVYPGPVSSQLEHDARAQYPAALLARAVPMGRAEPLARRIVDALDERRPRVVYPSLYEVGYHALGIASRVALALGPEPVS